MKKLYIFILIVFTTTSVCAQVGINTTDPKALLEIKSSSETTPTITDGLLIPKVNTFPATNPTVDQQGMLVYLKNTSGTNQPRFYYWNFGTLAWIPVGNNNTLGWNINGNAGTNAPTNFIGTTDNVDVVFKRNNVRAGFLGTSNTSFGLGALSSNASGLNNLAIGTSALRFNTTGNANTVNGGSALSSNITGNNNTANGNFTLSSNTTGSNNTATGYQSLDSNTTGNENSSLGSFSNVALTNLTNATAIGARATVGASNALVLGSINSVNGATASVNVGIGTSTPLDRLHVVGNIRMVDGNEALGKILISDANGTATWTNPSTISSGTLDQAYDFGGAGLGKTITADAGALLINGTDGLVSTGTLNTGAIVPSAAGTRMVWNPRKGAFRSGSVITSQWDDVNVGLLSTAFGSSTIASGNSSTAFGSGTVASGIFSTSFGSNTIASGLFSTSFGSNTIASGGGSVVFGSNNTASGVNSSSFGSQNTSKSIAETVFGIGATDYTISINGDGQFRSANATDRLFVVGNAVDANNNNLVDTAERRDALIILKNGLTRLPSTTTAMITAADGKAVVTKEFLLSSGSGGTLDQAYNFGGAGLGKTITADAGAVLINGTDGLVSTGTSITGAIVPSGAGTRMVWNPRKSAFRAGRIQGTEWDDLNVGESSVAFGVSTIASAFTSVAFGRLSQALGISSIASGESCKASGLASTAFGNVNLADGNFSIALGDGNDAVGLSSTAIGAGNNANGDYSFAIGSFNLASSPASFAIGTGNITSGSRSTAFGELNRADGILSTVFGARNTSKSFGETVLGFGATDYITSINGAFQFGVANATDRLFVIGNAIDINNNSAIDAAERSDALVILKNGNTGIGSSNPLDALHVVGKIRMVDGSQAAGRVLTCDANGTAVWNTFSATNAWGLGGNIGTLPTINFIGTSDNQNVIFKRDNIRAGLLDTNNTSFGVNALNSLSTGTNNTAIGVLALNSNTIGNNNTTTGFQALLVNTTGNNNTAIGVLALDSNTIGADNTAIGRGTLVDNIIGNSNTAIGKDALFNSTSNNNTAVGRGTLSGVTTGTNNTAIGFNAQVANASGDNQVRIGNTAVANANVQVAWTITSDNRWKSNIQKSNLGLDFIKQLNPVFYTRKDIRVNEGKTIILETTSNPTTEYGFIAQEIVATLNKFDTFNNGIISKDDAGMFGVRYNDLIAPMVKAIQEQQAIIDIQKTQIETQTQTIYQILERLHTLENKK